MVTHPPLDHTPPFRHPEKQGSEEMPQSGKHRKRGKCGQPKRRKSRERQRGGQKRGGGKTSRGEPPHGKRFPTPLTSVRFAPPPPLMPSLLGSPLEISRIFPQLTTSETVFGGSQKIVSDGPSSRGFAFRYVLPPPLALPRKCGKCGKLVLL